MFFNAILALQTRQLNLLNWKNKLVKYHYSRCW